MLVQKWITNEVAEKRWDNAKRIVNGIQRFCLKNNYGFMWGDENTIYKGDHLIVVDDEIFICETHNSKTVLYVNDKNRDEGVYETTEDWYKRTGLSKIQFVKLVDKEDFKILMSTKDDEVIYDK